MHFEPNSCCLNCANRICTCLRSGGAREADMDPEPEGQLDKCLAKRLASACAHMCGSLSQHLPPASHCRSLCPAFPVFAFGSTQSHTQSSLYLLAFFVFEFEFSAQFRSLPGLRVAQDLAYTEPKSGSIVEEIADFPLLWPSFCQCNRSWCIFWP